MGSTGMLKFCPREGLDQDKATRAIAVKYILQNARGRRLLGYFIASRGLALYFYGQQEEVHETRNHCFNPPFPQSLWEERCNNNQPGSGRLAYGSVRINIAGEKIPGKF